MDNNKELFVDLEEPQIYNNPNINLLGFMDGQKISIYTWYNVVSRFFPEFTFTKFINDHRW